MLRRKEIEKMTPKRDIKDLLRTLQEEAQLLHQEAPQ